MKPQDRLDAREGFENDKYNILVSTSVLEEGIDIQACNIVVRYMYIKDMIAKIQSKGICMLDSNSAPWHFTPWATRKIIGVVIHMYFRCSSQVKLSSKQMLQCTSSNG